MEAASTAQPVFRGSGNSPLLRVGRECALSRSDTNLSGAHVPSAALFLEHLPWEPQTSHYVGAKALRLLSAVLLPRVRPGPGQREAARQVPTLTVLSEPRRRCSELPAKATDV